MNELCNDNDLVFWSAHRLAQAIRERQISAVDVLEAHLAQYERHNKALNAIVTLNPAALKQAKAADSALAQGELWGPLHGVPVTFKDLFDTAGLRTTYSAPTLAQYIPRQDAAVVTRLRQAGVIVLGKTNLPYQGIDIQTVSPVFGRTNNPWDLKRTPGGSTGGGAAAVAAGLSPLELGNDLGCSLRLPAHFCGIYSLKPTEGCVVNSTQRLRYMLTSGPMARSVEDLNLCFELIAAPNHSEGVISPTTQFAAKVRSLSDYRFAWCDSFGDLRTDAQTSMILRNIAAQLETAGCHVEKVAPQGFDFADAWYTFGRLCTGQMGIIPNNWPYDWLRIFGRRVVQHLPISLLLGGPMVQGFVEGVTLSLPDFKQALHRRAHLMQQVERFLQPWDAWICPVAPGPAFTHRSTRSPLRRPIETENGAYPYWQWGMGFTSLFNLTGHPVVTIPTPIQNLPIGIQVVGKRGQDRELLAIAQALTTLTGHFQRPPNY
jgi:amidase